MNMSVNLADLPPDEKNAIEIDKQASFLVWKLKEGKSGPEAITQQRHQYSSESEQMHFSNCVDKYKRVMGVV
jgi:hypothetical protein